MASIALLWMLLQSDPLSEARRYAEQGDVQRAMDVLSEARESSPSPALLAFLAQLQAANDRIPQAAASLSEALELAPRQARLRATLGALYFRLRRLEDAEDELRRALENDEANPIAHYYLAATTRSLGRLDEAERHVERALELLPRETAFTPNDFSPRTNALYLSAELALARGQLDAAEHTLQDVLAREPSHAGAHYQLAQILLRADRDEQAERALELFQKTKTAQEHLERGLNLARHAGEPEKAIRELEQALEAFPNHPRALYFLAVELARAGRTEDALEMLERLVELRPDAARVADPIRAFLETQPQ